MGSHKLTPGSSGLQQQQQQHSQGSLAPAGSDGTAVAAAAAAAAVEDGADGGAAAAAASAAAAQVKARPSAEAKQHNGAQPGALAASSSISDVKQQAAAEHSLSLGELSSSLYGYRTDSAALVLLALCTAALAVGVGLESDHKWLRTNWMACLLGPLGWVPLPACLPAWSALLGFAGAGQACCPGAAAHRMDCLLLQAPRSSHGA